MSYNTSQKPTAFSCTSLAKIERRTCTTESLGYVLLADIVPCLLMKMIYPFIGKYVPMTILHVVVCILQAASLIIVAFASNTLVALIGVGLTSAGSGLGESFLLALTSFYSTQTIGAWSSGTGGAGLFGSLIYALLTEPHLANLSPRTTMLIMLVVPVIFFLTYFTILTSVPTIHEIAVSQSQYPCEQRMLRTLDNTKTAIELDSTTTASDGESNSAVLSDTSTRTAEEIKFIEKVRLVLPLVKYMIPLTLIYFAEYLINQGLIVFLVFDCAHGLGLSRESQYRWYQALYQIGVFISRSSIHFLRLPLYILIILTVLQWMNTAFFFCDAIYSFVPHICIIFALILFEGFFWRLNRSASYVNTFYQIHVQIHPLVREFSLSFATLADGIGIVLAGIFAIPTHNFVCKTLLHRT
ncbi:Battenin [Aphelenchoides besseyi]|nr:Battenin [Aphelenchoides besseyi]